jgi:putative transposase
VRRTLEQLGIPLSTFYQWYDRCQTLGIDGLENRPSAPPAVWNRLPDARRDQILNMALPEPDLSPHEITVKFIDKQRCFVCESTVYRILKDHDPAFILMKAADRF